MRECEECARTLAHILLPSAGTIDPPAGASCGHTGRERDRETERETERAWLRQKQGETDRERERERERELNLPQRRNGKAGEVLRGGLRR